MDRQREEVGVGRHLHAEANFRDGRGPVGGQFGLDAIKTGGASFNIEGFCVAPIHRFIAERFLWQKSLQTYIKKRSDCIAVHSLVRFAVIMELHKSVALT